MNICKTYVPVLLLFALTACSQGSVRDFFRPRPNEVAESVPEDFDFNDDAVTEQEARAYDEAQTYYAAIMPEQWEKVPGLDYSEGQVTIPLGADNKTLHYENKKTQARLDLYKEKINDGNYLNIITRRQAIDHCSFSESSYRKVKNVEIVVASASCRMWLDGDMRKYFFAKQEDTVYTFRLLTPPSEYAFVEADFDYFVNSAIDSYVLGSSTSAKLDDDSKFSHINNESLRRIIQEELSTFFAP